MCFLLQLLQWIFVILEIKEREEIILFFAWFKIIPQVFTRLRKILVSNYRFSRILIDFMEKESKMKAKLKSKFKTKFKLKYETKFRIYKKYSKI